MLKKMCTFQDIDYVIWTGDIPPHNIWNQTRSDQVSFRDKIVVTINISLVAKIFFGS